jgi:hypothetical protein
VHLATPALIVFVVLGLSGPVVVRAAAGLPRFTPRLHELRVAGRRVLIALGCVALPALLIGAFFSVAVVTPSGDQIAEPAFGFDFRPTWRAAGDVLDRESPYVPPVAAALDGEDQFVYPPAPAVAAIPLRVFSFDVAAVVFGLMLVLSTVLTLRLLGVRDWRCYGFVFLWIPVLASVRLGAISVLLTLGVALAWRYRNRALIAVAVVAGLIAWKIFLWPLVLWLAVTGRLREAAASVAGALAVTFGAWALIDFKGLADYPAMMSTLTDLVAWKSYSLVALGGALELSDVAARLVSLAVGGLALAAGFLFARRRSEDGEARALIAAIAAALALSPIVWTHYFALLIVPIALARPRLGPLWMLPLLFWLSPDQSDGELWRISLGLTVATAVFAIASGGALHEPLRLRGRVAVQPVGKA